MKPGEVKTLFPKVFPRLTVSAPDANGFSNIDTFITRTVPTLVDGDGIVYRSADESLKLSFFDDGLYAIEKTYLVGVETEPEWKTIGEFAAQISNAFKLDGTWTESGRLPASFVNSAPQPHLLMECRDFKIEVSFDNWNNAPKLSVIDIIALTKLKERYLANKQKAEDENKRKQNVFKP